MIAGQKTRPQGHCPTLELVTLRKGTLPIAQMNDDTSDTEVKEE